MEHDRGSKENDGHVCAMGQLDSSEGLLVNAVFINQNRARVISGRIEVRCQCCGSIN